MDGKSGVHELFQRIAGNADSGALAVGNTLVTYGELAGEVEAWRDKLRSEGIGPGSVVGISGDFSVARISLLLATFAEGAVLALVPQQEEQDRY